MDFWLDELRKISPILADLTKVAQFVTGVLGLLTAVVTFLGAVFGRVSSRVFTRIENVALAKPRTPIRLSLKSILLGWFSTLLWSVVAFGLFGFATGAWIEKTANPPAANSPQMPAEQESEKEKPVEQQPAPKAEGPSWTESNKQMQDFLNKNPQAQVILLVLAGLVYARGSYVAARHAKTTTLIKFAHGLVAVATLEITVGLILFYQAPDLILTTNPELVEKWGFLTMIAGCVLGSILGSEN